jgi:hypothetical protein
MSLRANFALTYAVLESLHLDTKFVLWRLIEPLLQH